MFRGTRVTTAGAALGDGVELVAGVALVEHDFSRAVDAPRQRCLHDGELFLAHVREDLEPGEGELGACLHVAEPGEYQVLLRPFDGAIDVGEDAAARERRRHAHVLEEVRDRRLFRHRGEQQVLAFLGEAVVREQQDLRAGAVDLVDALHVEDQVGDVVGPRRLEIGGEVFGGAEEDGIE